MNTLQEDVHLNPDKPSTTILTVSSKEEAEKIVYEFIKKGFNNRDILKQKFSIDGKIIGFNAYQIKMIKENFESKQTKSMSKDAVMFKLFKEGIRPVDVVIKTGYDAEDVNASYQKYLGLANKIEIPLGVFQELYELAFELDPYIENDNQFYDCLKRALSDVDIYRGFLYPCRGCSEPIQLTETEWPKVKEFLISRGWGHKGCH